jgi:hypothetical protein
MAEEFVIRVQLEGEGRGTRTGAGSNLGAGVALGAGLSITPRQEAAQLTKAKSQELLERYKDIYKEASLFGRTDVTLEKTRKG